MPEKTRDVESESLELLALKQQRPLRELSMWQGFTWDSPWERGLCLTTRNLFVGSLTT